jgi:hypothetical protein
MMATCRTMDAKRIEDAALMVAHDGHLQDNGCKKN